tara:strand:+ start:473 stop:1852 length:1380 start_codon:yes stop_codon:yes gene_type:complete
MKRLHIFLIKSFLPIFTASFFVTVFLFLMQFLWKYIDDLVGKGLDFTQIAELLFYASARFVPAALPIAILLSSVMVFGKLGEQYELMAIKSAGISFYKLLLPLMSLVIILSFSSFLFSNYIMPIANLKNASMIYDIQKKKPALNIKEGIFYNEIEGFSIKINKKDANGTILKDIIIYDHTSGEGNNKVLIAESGKMVITGDEKFLELTLYNGYSYVDIKDKKRNKTHPFRTTHFNEDLIRFNLESFKTMRNSEKLYKGHYAMLNNRQLDKAIDSLQLKYQESQRLFSENISSKYKIILVSDSILADTLIPIKDKLEYDIAINKIRTLLSVIKSNTNNLEYQNIIITKHKVEWHRKISLAFSCILFFLIGAPLGSVIRKGGFGIPVLVAALLFIFYYVINVIGEKSSKDLSMQPFEGMWLANLVFIPIAIFCIYKAQNNSKNFDLTRIHLIFNQFINKIN